MLFCFFIPKRGNIRLTYNLNYSSQKKLIDITANLCYNLITKKERKVTQ